MQATVRIPGTAAAVASRGAFDGEHVQAIREAVVSPLDPDEDIRQLLAGPQ